MEFHKQRLFFKNHLGKEESIGHFWIDENGEVDAENLPSSSEIARMLKLMRVKEIFVESTGVYLTEEP